MLSFRGDVHKFYLKVRSTFSQKKSLAHLYEIREIKEIRDFYRQLNLHDLQFIRYKMVKERSGMGIIPLIFGSLPWLGFIFSKQLQSLLFKDGAYLWAYFIIIYSIILTFGFVLHYREKAWAALHLEIIDDIINEKEE